VARLHYTLFILLAPLVALAQTEPDPLAASRDALTKWIETQRIISQEQANAKTAKLALEGRLALVQTELDEFSGKVAKSSEDIEAEAKRKANLEKELESAKLAPQVLTDGIETLETQIKALKNVLPGPVVEKTKALYLRVPEDPKTTKVSLAERYQNVLGILNEADKANNDLMLTIEVREIEGSKPTECETLYVGLAQAYFVNADRDFAGFGRPVDGKWVWTRRDDLAGEIAHVFNIMANKGKPKFVHLPVILD
jgi:hypothetical protein